MNQLQVVLLQKEQDLERVRREIQALLTVVLLLADDQPVSDEVTQLVRLASARAVLEPRGKGSPGEKTYYPFVESLLSGAGPKRVP